MIFQNLTTTISSPLYFYTKLSSRLHESLKDKNNVMLGILVSGPTWDQHQPTRDCGRATGVWIYIRQKRQGGGLWRKPLCVPAGGWGGLHMRFEYQGAAGPWEGRKQARWVHLVHLGDWWKLRGMGLASSTGGRVPHQMLIFQGGPPLFGNSVSNLNLLIEN